MRAKRENGGGLVGAEVHARVRVRVRVCVFDIDVHGLRKYTHSHTYKRARGKILHHAQRDSPHDARTTERDAWSFIGLENHLHGL